MFGRTHSLVAIAMVIAAMFPAVTLAQTSTSSSSASASRRLPHMSKQRQNDAPKQLQQRWTPDQVVDAQTHPDFHPNGLGLEGPGVQQAVMYETRNGAPTTALTQAMQPIEALPAPLETFIGSNVTNAVNEATPASFAGCASCGGDGGWSSGPVSSVGSCGCGSSGQNSGILLMPGVAVDHLSIFGGVQGFTNNSNRGADGSFGFHEGFNIGTAARNIIFPPSVGLQFGMQAVQANLNGAEFTLQERNQIFLTAGAFRRGDFGLQGGLAIDYLWDDWYYDLQVGQLRGELSMSLSPSSDYGFWFATPIDSETVEARLFGEDVTESWETTDIYAIFVRSNLLAGGTGEGKLFAGLTGQSDGIVGAQSRLPLMNGWALETEFTYLIPDEANGFGANEMESWNVGVQLAWYPGSLACGECFRYHRPLFDVANNGSMILRRK